MIQMQITLPENIMKMLRNEAAQCGITPNVLARIRLCTLFFGNETAAEKKSYVVTLENWKEAEAYVKLKQPGSTVGDFAAKTTTFEMRRCPLSPAQKAEFDRLLVKQG
ncbi:MAG: hypothetical protein LBG95_00765 [Treponema sp.]|jgi:hypothetical protein|nr:hypothetical protein [Treponema sp.]